MKWILAVFVVLAIAMLIAIALRRALAARTDDSWPFIARKPLSRPEQVLYFRLQRALPDHMVLAQVQLSRVLGVKRSGSYQSWLNRISQLSADFVVCAKDATVLTVIELDDSSHDDPRRREADARKSRAVEAAGLRLVRWRATALPDDATIRSSVLPGASGGAVNAR